MAATEITAVAPARAINLLAGESANTAGNYFANNGQQLLIIESTGAGTATVTIATPLTIDGEAVADKVVAIGAGERHLLGFFPPAWYNDAESYVQLSYSAVVDIKVAVITTG